MYRQQYNLPPINPAAFGGLPQQGPQGGPPMSPPNNVGGPQAQPPMDMNKYLIKGHGDQTPYGQPINWCAGRNL